jgi:hypothetical protein
LQANQFGGNVRQRTFAGKCTRPGGAQMPRNRDRPWPAFKQRDVSRALRDCSIAGDVVDKIEIEPSGKITIAVKSAEPEGEGGEQVA